MSRTYKHTKKVKLKRYYRDRWDSEHEKIEYVGCYYTWPDLETPTREYIGTRYLKKPGVRPKLRKEIDSEDHWMNTPSWWVNLMMTKPQRREGSLWEREVVKTPLEDLDGVDTPNISKKPHIYFW